MNASIENIRNSGQGDFLPHTDCDQFAYSINGKEIADWLRSEGYKVASTRALSRYSTATTECGMTVSSSGCCNIA